MAANSFPIVDQSDLRDQYNTPLTSQELPMFQQWKQKYAPQDTGSDYDLQGAFKAGIKPDGARGHFPDTFKKPNHPTFSTESQYHGKDGHFGGSWTNEGGKDYYSPGPTNLRFRTNQQLQSYFDTVEPDAILLNRPGQVKVPGLTK